MAEYYFPRYWSIPAEQMFLPTYYNPYAMRGQRYIPYTGCGGCHPAGGPPTASAMTPVNPYNETIGIGPAGASSHRSPDGPRRRRSRREVPALPPDDRGAAGIHACPALVESGLGSLRWFFREPRSRALPGPGTVVVLHFRAVGQRPGKSFSIFSEPFRTDLRSDGSIRSPALDSRARGDGPWRAFGLIAAVLPRLQIESSATAPGCFVRTHRSWFGTYSRYSGRVETRRVRALSADARPAVGSLRHSFLVLHKAPS